MSTNKDIARSASVIGIFTFCSRLLGFVRDMVIARFFGTYVYAQAFVVAFRIPNLFRDMVAEGASNSAFVPVFSEYSTRKTKEEFWHLANCVLNISIIALSVITILGVVFAPLLVRFIAPGFASEPAKLEETIRLTRIIYPYILLVSLAAYCMGILNSLKHFAFPAFAPCLLNISIIIFAMTFGEGVLGLAFGVLVGGLLQLAVQIPVLYKRGFRYKWVFDTRHPAVRQIGRLILPRMFSSCVYQLNVFVDTILSSFSNIVGPGAVAALYFANRIFQFPLGIFGVAVAQASLPTMSVQALEESKAGLKKTLNFSLVAVFLVMLPVSMIFMTLGKPIVEILFQRGRFGAYSTAITSYALLFYSLGLSCCAANKMITSCFFALKDTKTPLNLSAVSLMLNIVLNLILMYPLKLGGLALATSISAAVSFFLLLGALRKKIGPIGGRYLLRALSKILFASIMMVLACLYVQDNFFKNLLPARIIAAISCGLAVFITVSILTRLEELPKVFKWIFAKK